MRFTSGRGRREGGRGNFWQRFSKYDVAQEEAKQDDEEGLTGLASGMLSTAKAFSFFTLGWRDDDLCTQPLASASSSSSSSCAAAQAPKELAHDFLPPPLQPKSQTTPFCSSSWVRSICLHLSFFPPPPPPPFPRVGGRLAALLASTHFPPPSRSSTSLGRFHTIIAGGREEGYR